MIYTMYDETSSITDVFMHEPGLECKTALEAEDPGMWTFDSSLKGVDSSEWIVQAKQEHQGLVKLLQEQRIKVHYLTELLSKPSVKGALKCQLENSIKEAFEKKLLPATTALTFFKTVQTNPIAAALQGVQTEFEAYKKLEEKGLSILIPKPNAYFSQDPFAIIGDYFVKLKPATFQRSGEPELWKLALQPFPENYIELKNESEGGDITLWNNYLFVGVGTRTTLEAAQELYKNNKKFGLNGVIIVLKPDAYFALGMNHTAELSFIHMDTIKMPLQNGGVLGSLELMSKCTVWHYNNGYGELLKLNDFVTKTSNTIVPVSPDEQYSLAANILPANGVVISAKGNIVTNTSLAKVGYQVKTFETKALLGGCGSAHCMSNAANHVSIS